MCSTRSRMDTKGGKGREETVLGATALMLLPGMGWVAELMAEGM